MKNVGMFHKPGKQIRLLLAGALCAMLLALAAPAGAAVFTVNSTVDAVDANPGNGVCATAGGFCTLRAAITEANAAPGSTIVLPAGTYTLTIPPDASPDDNMDGDLDILTSMTITGTSAAGTIIDGNNIDRIFDIYGAGPVNISAVTVRNGNTGGQGGGISNASNLSLTDVVITANQGSSGGGIWCANTSQLQLNRVVISNNSGNNGGGLYGNLGLITINNSTISGNASNNKGGGLYLKDSTTLLTNSTISGNSATGSGGGIYNQGSLSLTNVTVSGNSALSGGGIYFQFGGTMMNLTIAYNSATSGAGIYNNDVAVALSNTIVAHSSGSGNCGSATVSPRVTSNGYNLDDANTCGFANTGDLQNKNSELNALANNGGPTMTHALKNNSSAIDAGTTVGAPATDQRGFPRVAPYDIGAYEATGGSVYQPDLLIKLPSEADAAYLTGNLYESPVATQSKSQLALNGTAATYLIKIQNNGNSTDNIKINGSNGDGNFAVQYLDDASVDRTAAVSVAGYTIPNLAAGASGIWTLKVTPTAGISGGSNKTVAITATSTKDSTKKDQVQAITTTPALAIVKQVWEATGTVPLLTTTAPVGTPLDFLIYVKNTTAIAVADVRINDILDETAFDYVPGSLFRTSAATPPADTATDLQIFTATASGTGTPLSDGLDGDVASALNTGGLPAVDRITVGAVVGQANGILTIAPNSTFALRYRVKIK